MGKLRNAYNILVRRFEWKRPFGRTRHRCEDNKRKDLGEIV
jgi:hypothetical protein